VDAIEAFDIPGLPAIVGPSRSITGSYIHQDILETINENITTPIFEYFDQLGQDTNTETNETQSNGGTNSSEDTIIPLSEIIEDTKDTEVKDSTNDTTTTRPTKPSRDIPGEILGLFKEIGKTADGTVAKVFTEGAFLLGILLAAIPAIFGVTFSLSEVVYAPVRLWSLAMTYLGIYKRNRPWGVVFDSQTKQPLDPVYIQLFDTMQKEVATTITDMDGRYGFLVEPGKYQIKVNKDGYKFPSEKLAGKKEDVLYRDLYFGEYIEVTDKNSTIVKNIPMDNLKFNWNEYVKSKKNLTKYFNRHDALFMKISNIIFSIGFSISLMSLIYSQTPLNIVIFSLYVLILIVKRLVLKPKSYGMVVDKNSSSPAPFTIIRVFSEGGNEIMHKVSDKCGKYLCLLKNGTYKIQLQKKNENGEYDNLLETKEIVSSGYISKKYKV